MTNCDGSQSDVIAALQCTIPLATLTLEPYSLVFGNSVWSKITATNFYGESAESDQGNGAIILLVPDAPVGLADNVAVTTAYVIGFTWNDGMSVGGSPIIDYRVSFDHSTGTYEYLDSGITTKSYSTSVVLTPGATYSFKVEARNSVGYSLPSAELQILCA